MDAADRAELDALRRRAYGPSADIHDDPLALARLVELEDLTRAQAAEAARALAVVQSVAVAVGDRPAPASAALSAGDARAPDPAAAGSPSPRRPWARRGTLIASAAAVVAVVVAVTLTQLPGELSPGASPTPPMDDRFMYHGDPGSETLMTIALDQSFGNYVELPADGEGPTFPATTTLDWMMPLGTYFGWQLWTAGSGGEVDDEHCILIERGTDVRARCLTPTEQNAGKLQVSLEASDILPEDLPRPMEEDERIRFWWLIGDKVDVVLGTFEG